MSFLRRRGFVSVIYLDDLLCIAPDRQSCTENVEASVTLLNKLGFIINYKKSELIPNNRCKFLGFV